MSSTGLEWYKRQPLAYLQDTQGLTAKEHAVYSVVIDLLYVHGGEINNDPKFIGGWIADMGTASIRNTLASLAKREKITIEITETKISQKRAKNEAKTKEKLKENARENGKKGGEKSAELRAESKENNDLGQAVASTQIQADKIREDKNIDDDDSARDDLTDREVLLGAMGLDPQACTPSGRIMGNQFDMLEAAKWRDDLGLSLDEQCAVIRDVIAKSPSTISSFKYFSGPMSDYAGRKKRRLEPSEIRVINGGGRFQQPEVDQETIIRSAAAGTTQNTQEW